MFYFALCGFLIGLILPITSGRFGKILPADPGEVLLRLWHRPHFPRALNLGLRYRLKQKWKKLGLVSLLWAFALSALFAFSYLWFSSDLRIWSCVLITLLSFCIVIDDLYYLLPDFFTLPMLICGFAFASLTGAISPLNSLIGAVFGYFIATLTVFLIGLIRKMEFGFGDVKMMTAIGAWLGMQGLNYAIILSFFLFAIPTILKGKRQGAYGPALAIATAITFFYIYCR